MSSWSVVYERTTTGWSAYVPALPGIGVAGATRAETERLAAEGIAFHLEGLATDGLAIPAPDGVDVGHVEVALPA
jgi:predicted RNase H-like HicB family nuclease